MRKIRTLAILTTCALLVAGCGVNKSIHIADGETVEDGKATVNGNVFIGADCTVRGDCRTVNGGVTVDITLTDEAGNERLRMDIFIAQTKTMFEVKGLGAVDRADLERATEVLPDSVKLTRNG